MGGAELRGVLVVVVDVDEGTMYADRLLLEELAPGRRPVVEIDEVVDELTKSEAVDTLVDTA